jgi:hypothetical protein
MNNLLNSDDCGLLIGLISTPSDINSNDFFKKEIQNNLSKIYSESRMDYARNGPKDYSSILYKPVGYKTFGDHDIAILTLFDDFSYPNRVFHPSHGNRDASSLFYKNYEYQVFSCLNSAIIKKENQLENQFSEISTNINYPFICITRVKVNSFILIGNGIDFIELVKESVYRKAKDIKVVILDCLGSEELVILLFSNNLSSISLSIHNIRCLKINDLDLLPTNKKLNLIESSLSECFKADTDWVDSHIFTSIYLLPGYRIEIPDEYKRFKFTKESSDLKISIDFTWDLKPGHVDIFRLELEEYLKDNKIGEKSREEDRNVRLNINSWSYKYEFKNYQESSNYINFICIEKLREFDKECKHIRKLHMRMSIMHNDFNISMSPTAKNSENHPKSKELCNKFQVQPEELIDIRSSLEVAKVSKLTRERILKMYNNYNNCIIDPLFFANFIDLHGFMQSFKNKIKDYSISTEVESSNEFHEFLNRTVSDFEQAYYNRFHQSNRMRNMTDFNIEWNGGIQQLISPYDYIFKKILNSLNYKKDDRFVYVTGYDRVNVSQHSFKINMLHLTYPELFVSTIWKEIFNFYWKDATRNETIPLFQFFRSSNFPKILNREIIDDPDFDQSSEVHHFLQTTIDSDFTTTMIADTLAFFYGYNFEYVSYSFWYWRVLLQSSQYYEKDGKINPKIFIKFLARTLFILLHSNKNIEDYRFMPADSSLSELWMANFDEVYSFVKIQYKVLERYEYHSKFILFSTTKMQSDIGESSYLTSNTSSFNITKQRGIEFNILQKKYSYMFSENKICLDRDDFDNKLFIPAYFYAYLQYIRFLDCGPIIQQKSQFLNRDVKGKPQIESSEDCYYNILADPLGGFFCINDEIQRKYFCARSIFFRTIFNYCNICKKETINQMLNK